MDSLEFRDEVRAKIDDLIKTALANKLAEDDYSSQLYITRVVNDYIGDEYTFNSRI